MVDKVCCIVEVEWREPSGLTLALRKWGKVYVPGARWRSRIWKALGSKAGHTLSDVWAFVLCTLHGSHFDILAAMLRVDSRGQKWKQRGCSRAVSPKGWQPILLLDWHASSMVGPQREKRSQWQPKSRVALSGDGEECGWERPEEEVINPTWHVKSSSNLRSITKQFCGLGQVI